MIFINRNLYKASFLLQWLFISMITAWAQAIGGPTEREIQDLRPRQGTRIIDAVLRIPNINDDFNGTGPDCGAYEAGQELPHYGPRKLN